MLWFSKSYKENPIRFKEEKGNILFQHIWIRPVKYFLLKLDPDPDPGWWKPKIRERKIG